MFVMTEFNTIVNLAEFDKIKIEFDVEQDSGDVLHIISAVSEEMIKPTGVNEYPKHVLKSKTLLQGSKDAKALVERAYNRLFCALEQGKIAFHITLSHDGMEGKVER